MKKISAALLATLILSACAADGGSSALNTGTGIGSSLVKMAVDNQCRTELNKHNEWRMIALAMSAEKQAEWENRICGCASEEAPNQLTANELVQVLNANTRTQAVASVTAKTVNACFQRIYKGN